MQRFHSAKFFISLLLAAFIALSFSFAQAKISRLQEVDPGVWRGSQPSSAADFDKLEEMGIKTIITLQWDKSVDLEKTRAKKSGIKIIQIPLNARERPGDESIEKIFKELLNPKNRPVYLHCKLGRDRTGMIFAFYRIRVQGWSAKDAYDEWIEGGFQYKFLRNMDNYFKEKTGLSEAAEATRPRRTKRARECRLRLS
jgi:protein tyrosine/serine phosphatase